MEIGHFLDIPVTPSSTWLLNLTHIDLFPWGEYPPDELSSLAHLARLTHACLHTYYTIGTGHVAMVCSSCPRLQVLIIVGRLSDQDLSDLQEIDRRIVEQVIPSDLAGDWKASYDMWCRAEATMAHRKALSAGNE